MANPELRITIKVLKYAKKVRSLASLVLSMARSSVSERFDFDINLELGTKINYTNSTQCDECYYFKGIEIKQCDQYVQIYHSFVPYPRFLFGL